MPRPQTTLTELARLGFAELSSTAELLVELGEHFRRCHTCHVEEQLRQLAEQVGGSDGRLNAGARRLRQHVVVVGHDHDWNAPRGRAGAQRRGPEAPVRRAPVDQNQRGSIVGQSGDVVGRRDVGVAQRLHRAVHPRGDVVRPRGLACDYKGRK